MAGLLASGFTIVSALLLSLVVVLVFSDSPTRDGLLVGAVFGVISLIPVWAMRTPKDPVARGRPRRFRFLSFFRRHKRQSDKEHVLWKRRRGQTHHQPFGAPEMPRPSTFVAAPRKPTDP